MDFDDYIGLCADEAVEALRKTHPYLKVCVFPTMAPRFKGHLNLSKTKVVRQRYMDNVFELTVVIVD